MRGRLASERKPLHYSHARIYINKETRVAKFPALSRVIKFKHRGQARGDGFCRKGVERGAWSERESSAGKMCVCIRGVPIELVPMVFPRANKRTMLYISLSLSHECKGNCIYY